MQETRYDDSLEDPPLNKCTSLYSYHSCRTVLLFIFPSLSILMVQNEHPKFSFMLITGWYSSTLANRTFHHDNWQWEVMFVALIRIIQLYGICVGHRENFRNAVIVLFVYGIGYSDELMVSLYVFRWMPPALPTTKTPEVEKESEPTYAAGRTKVVTRVFYIWTIILIWLYKCVMCYHCE